MSDEEVRRKNEVFQAADAAGSAPSQGSALPGVQQQQDEFGFVVPVDLAPLPSSGKTYPLGHPFTGLEAVEIRAMTARDEDILTSRALVKNGTVITQLVKSCLNNKLVDPRMLLSGDRWAIMVAIRVTGYGREYAVEAKCPACDEKVDYTFDLSRLPVKRLELDPVEPNTNLFDYRMERSGAHVLWRFMTGADDEEIAQMDSAKKKAKFVSDSAVTTRLTRMIVSINGITDRAKIAAAVPRIPALDSSDFRTYVTKHEPGIEFKATLVCSQCGESSEVDVPMGASFFWPAASR